MDNRHKGDFHKVTALVTLSYLFLTPPLLAKTLNGFKIQDPLIPAHEIYPGGPSRDGIPPIDRPQFIPAHQMKDLGDNDLVVGFLLGKDAKAYPIGILNYHEIVNDAFGDLKVSITYCPLCGTAMVFRQPGSTLGVSGLLYQSDLLLYDRKTKSLWSQILMKAVNGPKKGETLELLASQLVTWKAWKTLYPKTRVLSFDTGYLRNYTETPYKGYEKSPKTYFPINKTNQLFHAKETTLALIDGERVKLYAASVIKKNKQGVTDLFGSHIIRLTYDPKTKLLAFQTNKQSELKAIQGYWFALYTFYPQAEIYNP